MNKHISYFGIFFTILIVSFSLGGLFHFEAASITKKTEKNIFKQYKILFVGDTSFGENYQLGYGNRGKKENLLLIKGYDYFLQRLNSVLMESDFVIANLETPITDAKESNLTSKKQYLHWADIEKTPKYLKKYNIKVVSLANNHTLDYGLGGLKDTINYLDKNGIEHFGAGFSEQEAAEPYLIKIKASKEIFTIAIISGFEYHRKYDREFRFYAKGNVGGVNMLSAGKISKQIEELKAAIPNLYVVVFPHWGMNYRWKGKKQTQLAHDIIDAGADIVIGHGAHMMQEIEKYNGHWILYNIGNFMFNSQGRYQKFNVRPFSLVVQFLLQQKNGGLEKKMKIYPIFTDNLITCYQSRFLTKEEFVEFYDLLINKSSDKKLLTGSGEINSDDIGFFIELPLK